MLPKNVSTSGTAYNTMLQTQLQELQNQLQRFFELPAKVSHAQVQKPVKAELNLFLLNNPLSRYRPNSFRARPFIML